MHAYSQFFSFAFSLHVFYCGKRYGILEKRDVILDKRNKSLEKRDATRKRRGKMRKKMATYFWAVPNLHTRKHVQRKQQMISRAPWVVQTCKRPIGKWLCSSVVIHNLKESWTCSVSTTVSISSSMNSKPRWQFWRSAHPPWNHKQARHFSMDRFSSPYIS